MDGGKTKFIKIYKGMDVVESLDPIWPEETPHIKKKITSFLVGAIIFAFIMFHPGLYIGCVLQSRIMWR